MSRTVVVTVSDIGRDVGGAERRLSACTACLVPGLRVGNAVS